LPFREKEISSKQSVNEPPLAKGGEKVEGSRNLQQKVVGGAPGGNLKKGVREGEKELKTQDVKSLQGRIIPQGPKTHGEKKVGGPFGAKKSFLRGGDGKLAKMEKAPTADEDTELLPGWGEGKNL